MWHGYLTKLFLVITKAMQFYAHYVKKKRERERRRRVGQIVEMTVSLV